MKNSNSNKVSSLRGHKLLITLLCLFAFSGCLRTDLFRGAIGPNTFQLAAVNQNPIRVEVSSSLSGSTLGHQFLLVAIPFGTIKLKDPQLYTLRTAYGLLAERGITPITSSARKQDGEAKTLRLRLTKASITGYDFLFFRRIVCRITIEGDLLSKESKLLRSWVSETRFAENSKYAFAPQLTYVLNKTLDIALDEVFANLGI